MRRIRDEMSLPKPRKMSRRVEARQYNCGECAAKGVETKAEDFCGAWINDGSNQGVGRECRKALCDPCAEKIFDLWLCFEHRNPKTESVDSV